jgi:hypothetical protein
VKVAAVQVDVKKMGFVTRKSGTNQRFDEVRSFLMG